MTTRLILDCDTGTDDAVAIMLAALHPELDLVAVTTVNGNVPVGNCTDNSLRVLDHIGRGEIPVYAGAASPLARDDFPVPRSVVEEGHGEHLDLPPARSAARDGIAAVFLVDRLARARADGEDVVVVATGPLTNLALALRLDPAFASNVGRLVIMGGGHEMANITASAEFNIWCDPEAARVVLSSGIEDIVLVTLDATHRALISTADCERLRSSGTPAGEATALFVERRVRAWPAEHRPDATALHDPLCVAYLLDPTVLSTGRYWVGVETAGGLTIGRTVIDTHRAGRHEPNARVALDADEKTFVGILTETFSARGRALPR